jgi:hypothetical protein
MAKQTEYSELRNTLLVISFNQRTGANGQDIQPVVIEARTEAITPEGAVRNVKNQVNIGEIVQEPLNNEELYKLVFGLSPVLAKALEGVLLDSIEEDMSAVSVKDVQPIGIADIAVK